MRRAITQLEAHPSPAQLREMFRLKTGRDVDDMAREFVNAPVGLLNHPQWTPVVHGQTVTVGDVLTGQRLGDALELMLCFAPRSKKGHTTLGIRQSPQYRAYRDNIVTVVKHVKAKLGLPLPPRPAIYNLAAVYYVDRYGKTADLFGLHDGLADALQDAGVIENDWQLRTSDGSRIVVDDPRPRVEITITRLIGS